jgi:CRISPR-associated protein Csm2
MAQYQNRPTSAVTTRNPAPRDQRGGGAGGGGNYRDRDRDEPTLITSKIVFSPVDANLFNDVARQTAETVAENRNANKPAQIRKFYDEFCLWETKANLEPARFAEYLPFILMLNAKVAYAKGRKLVDANFAKLLGDSLKQVKDPETLRICKLFFEAFLGFYKELRPSDK